MHFPVYIPSDEADSGHWEFCQIVVAEHRITLAELPIKYDFWHYQGNMVLERWRLIIALVTIRRHMSLLRRIMYPSDAISSSQGVACNSIVNRKIDDRDDVIAWCDSASFIVYLPDAISSLSPSCLIGDTFQLQVIGFLCLTLRAHIGEDQNFPCLLSGS